MTLISETSFEINEAGNEPKNIFPQLVGNPFVVPLQIDNKIYIAQFTYSYIAEWLILKVIDENNEVVQGETFVQSFPTNLLIAEELKEYALFYIFKDKKFLFYKLSDEWYNTTSMTEDELYTIYASEVIQ